jgi:protein phosphatase
MAYHVELLIAAKTDTGLVRAHNEDSIALSPECGLAILADGMGGYNAGEVASSIATSTLKESVEQQIQSHGWHARANLGKYIQHLLVGSVERANNAILDAARAEPQFSGMGTTVVAACFHHDKMTVAHVGDSRLYRLRRGVLTLLTRDHSLLQEQIDAGMIDAEMARFSPNRNLITRAVGVEHTINVEIHDHQTQVGDTYLLCSDGLSDMLSMQEIAEILNKTASDLELTCDALVARANRNGGRDNTSVILVTVQSSEVSTARLPKRALNWISDKTKVRWRRDKLAK